MALYVAYGVLVMHVALGLMQENRRIFIPIFLGGSFALVAALHIAAAWREREATQGARWLAHGRPAGVDPRQACPRHCRRRTASVSRCFATATRSVR